MVIKVGINGFGRIGRVIFRTCLQNPDIELSAINDPAIDIEYICYLIKFDSTHGKFKGNVTHTENQINIDDRLIKVFRDKLPHTVPWQVAGVQYVIEASGMFTCLEKSSGHLASDCVKRVIVTAPSADVPMIILGVNDNKLNADQKVLSCASSTLYCLAPIVKVLEENYGVSEGFITSIHAMTPSLKPLDGLCLRGKHWRDHRSIHQNIIPASTGSCNALAKIIPQVKDKMTGLAFRVPIVNVSVLDLTVRLNTNTSLQHIIKSVEKASKSFLQNIIKISNDEAVSSDFSGDSHSCILDADCSLQLKPDFYKIICWYENEYSYACRVLDSIFFSERQFNKSVRLPCKMTYVRPKFMKKQDEVQQTDIKITETSSTECNTEIPKINTLNESMLKRKPLIRPVVLRKPLSTHSSGAAATLPAVNRDTKKRNELFKIWNDNNDAQKNAARQNRGSFFHSCISFVPKATENTDCKKAQERLENVKREFNKMVNITEDLLKKSNNSNKLQPTTKSPLQEVKLGAKVGSKESKTTVKFNDQPAKDLMHDNCGDFKNRVAPECSNEEVRCSSSNERNENYSDYNIESTVKKNESNKKSNAVHPQEKTISFSKQNSVTNLGQKVTVQAKLLGKTNEMLKKNLNCPSKESLVQCTVKEHKEMTPKILDSVVKESAVKEHKEMIPKNLDNVVKPKVEENKVQITEVTHQQGRVPHVPAEKKVCITQEIDSPEKIHQRELNKYLHKKDHNMHVIDEELQKRNIVLVNNQEQNNTEMNLKSCNTINEQLIVETNKRRKNLSKHILECLNRKAPMPVVIVPEDTAECSPSGAATATNNGNGVIIKPDLYDKLDSASATDSNNSFEITERKSQVIHITDLTNSLEDLARLDKICRIIEISDELSDKLFSSLDQSELTVQQKNWSFRDLCERIQLDDFCNKVFGHSRS